MTVPLLDAFDASAWQDSWDRQQAAYMPDREDRFGVMLDVVAATVGSDLNALAARPVAPKVLDLAGGTGSISLRTVRRFPGATTTVLDIDPVLLTVARASVDDRSTVVSADLRTPTWVESLPRRDYDAVLTATALHWIDEERLAALYAEVREVLRPGGVFINADHMADGGLPSLSDTIGAWEATRREARWSAGEALSWEDWWASVERDPALGPLVPRRRAVFGGLHAAEFTPAADWHIAALRAAGFREAGLVWRGLRDAAVAALR